MSLKRVIFFIFLSCLESACVPKKLQKSALSSESAPNKSGNNYRDYNLLQGQGYFNTCWSVSLVGLAEHVYYMKHPEALKKLRETGIRELILNTDYVMYQELAESLSTLVRNSPPDKIGAYVASYQRHGAIIPSFEGGYVGSQIASGELGGLSLLAKYGVRKLNPDESIMNRVPTPEVADALVEDIQQKFANPFLSAKPKIPASWKSPEGISKDILSNTLLFRNRDFYRISESSSARPEIQFMSDVIGFDPGEFREFIIKDQETFEIGMKALRRALAASYIVPMVIGLDSQGQVSPKGFTLPPGLGPNEKDWILDLTAAHVVNVVSVWHKGHELKDVQSPTDELLRSNLEIPVENIMNLIVQNSSNNDRNNLNSGVYAGVSIEYLKALVQTQLKTGEDSSFSLVLPKSVLDDTDAALLQDGVKYETDGDEKGGFVAVECSDVRSGLNPLLGMFKEKYNTSYWNKLNQKSPGGGILTVGDQRWLFFGFTKDQVPPKAVRLKSQLAMAKWKDLILTLNDMEPRASLGSGEKCWQATYKFTSPDQSVTHIQGVGPMNPIYRFGSYNVAANLAKAHCFRLAAESGLSDRACEPVSSDTFSPVAGCHPYISERVEQPGARTPVPDKYSFFVPSLNSLNDLKNFDSALRVPLKTLAIKSDLVAIKGAARKAVEGENCPKPVSQFKKHAGDFLYGEDGQKNMDPIAPVFFY